MQGCAQKSTPLLHCSSVSLSHSPWVIRLQDASRVYSQPSVTADLHPVQESKNRLPLNEVTDGYIACYTMTQSTSFISLTPYPRCASACS